ncbi:MAG: class I SAM-dependent methyltransferase [Acidobacteriota bacterium]|nr:class I SAM-dependent methyltransferase [Acidobacteriota bacterium]
MDCDAIAPWYQILEYLAFGRRLEQHRFRFLSSAARAQKALVLGDGDGRFLKRFASAYPSLRIDSIEISSAMSALSKSSVGNSANVRLMQGDARIFSFPQTDYDFIATHFFLDCFAEADLEALVCKVAEHALPEALWIVSEFRKPAGFWRGLHAELWLRTMYLFFRFMTGLQTSKLPDHRRILQAHGFVLIEGEASMGQFVCSELWQLS